MGGCVWHQGVDATGSRDRKEYVTLLSCGSLPIFLSPFLGSIGSL